MIIQVLILGDTAFKRMQLSKLISANPYMVVVNISRNVIDAIKMVEKYKPDVLLIDVSQEKIEMMYGFKILNIKNPTPAIFFIENHKVMIFLSPIIRDFKFKNFFFIVKPDGQLTERYGKIREKLISNILRISNLKIEQLERFKKSFNKKISTKDENYEKLKIKQKIETYRNSQQLDRDISSELYPIQIKKLETNVIVMGASVGGPKTLPSILKEIPKTFPSPILVVQHMNHFFMRQFATTLRQKCNLPVKIPKNGEVIKPSTIYLSPGGMHMEIIVRNNLTPCIRTFEGQPVNYCRPSVDVLFYSAARVYKKHTLGILLTGMGKDGVDGLIAIKKMKGITVAESEETSILYGMPKVAKESQAANFILPNYKIKNCMIKFSRKL